MQAGDMNNQSVTDRVRTEAEGRKKRRRIVAIITLILAVVIAMILGLYMCTDIDLPGRQRNLNAELGQLDGKSDEEIQAELNRVVDESMFDISIASVIEYEDGESEGEVRIENVPGNHYMLDCVITQSDTGDVLYSSGLLEPNHHVTKAKLLKDLDAGTYPCIATFTAYDMETEEVVGAVNAEITVIVHN